MKRRWEMANIEEIRKAVDEFLRKTLNARDVKVIKVAKTGEGWKTEAEVYEESSFIKSLGLTTKVQDRNVYSVKLSNGLEVEAYERINEGPAEEL
jgi:TATA-binding protein-associated factor Taf7